MVEKEVEVYTPPVEFTDVNGRMIGINGARFNQILAQQSPFNRFMATRLKGLGLSTKTPLQRHIVELDI